MIHLIHCPEQLFSKNKLKLFMNHTIILWSIFYVSSQSDSICNSGTIPLSGTFAYIQEYRKSCRKGKKEMNWKPIRLFEAFFPWCSTQATKITHLGLSENNYSPTKDNNGNQITKLVTLTAESLWTKKSNVRSS